MRTPTTYRTMHQSLNHHLRATRPPSARPREHGRRKDHHDAHQRENDQPERENLKERDWGFDEGEVEEGLVEHRVRELHEKSGVID